MEISVTDLMDCLREAEMLGRADARAEYKATILMLEESNVTLQRANAKLHEERSGTDGPELSLEEVCRRSNLIAYEKWYDLKVEYDDLKTKYDNVFNKADLLEAANTQLYQQREQLSEEARIAANRSVMYGHPKQCGEGN